MFIIASVGFDKFSEEKIRKIILAGADALRYSFSYGPIQDTIDRINSSAKIIDELNSSAKIIVNLPSNQVRLAGPDTPRKVLENEEIILKSASADHCPKKITSDVEDEPLPKENICIHIAELGNQVYINQITTIDHGKIALQVTEIINNETVGVRALNEGTLQSGLSIHIAQNTENEAYLNRLSEILSKLEEVAPDYLAIPFISPAVNEKIKKLSDFSWQPKKICRIENRIAMDNLEKICQDDFYDLILLNRGKLGLDMPFERLGIFQKEAIAMVKKYKKQVIISSQILEGSIYNYIPLRSDILDLTNIVLDGADGIMLCNETALSARPAYTLSVAKKIILETEKYKKSHGF
ncbi:MAG TPA: pyruvate kinase [Candidatus Udaeobacter sp.]|nr:pyruvate kinase [Candidatus Udaeobacter sp.]